MNENKQQEEEQEKLRNTTNVHTSQENFEHCLVCRRSFDMCDCYDEETGSFKH